MTNSIANYNNSIFLVEVEKIRPNPFQPRNDFDDSSLQDLADSVRQYGILQPLVVTRKEELSEDGGLRVYYELIAGERRLRASKLAGLSQVPVIIRSREETDRTKLELAIIENLQREDLNPIDRALAFEKLTGEFGMTHLEVGKKMGKSREYVSNSLRLLHMPEPIKEALRMGKIAEGHSRPIMMLRDHPEEQMSLFKEIMYKKLSVRDAERIARSVAVDKVRKVDSDYDPTIVEYEKKFAEKLGTRVMIEKKPKGPGGRLMIDFISPIDLENFLSMLRGGATLNDPQALMKKYFPEEKLEELGIIKPQTEPVNQPMTMPDLNYIPTPDKISNSVMADNSPKADTPVEPDEFTQGLVDDSTSQDEEDDFAFLDELFNTKPQESTPSEMPPQKTESSFDLPKSESFPATDNQPVNSQNINISPINLEPAPVQNFSLDKLSEIKPIPEISELNTTAQPIASVINDNYTAPVSTPTNAFNDSAPVTAFTPTTTPKVSTPKEKSLADILAEIDGLDFDVLNKPKPITPVTPPVSSMPVQNNIPTPPKKDSEIVFNDDKPSSTISSQIPRPTYQSADDPYRVKIDE